MSCDCANGRGDKEGRGHFRPVIQSLKKCIMQSFKTCVMPSLKKCVVPSFNTCVMKSLKKCVTSFKTTVYALELVGGQCGSQCAEKGEARHLLLILGISGIFSLPPLSRENRPFARSGHMVLSSCTGSEEPLQRTRQYTTANQ